MAIKPQRCRDAGISTGAEQGRATDCFLELPYSVPHRQYAILERLRHCMHPTCSSLQERNQLFVLDCLLRLMHAHGLPTTQTWPHLKRNAGEIKFTRNKSTRKYWVLISDNATNFHAFTIPFRDSYEMNWLTGTFCTIDYCPNYIFFTAKRRKIIHATQYDLWAYRQSLARTNNWFLSTWSDEQVEGQRAVSSCLDIYNSCHSFSEETWCICDGFSKIEFRWPSHGVTVLTHCECKSNSLLSPFHRNQITRRSGCRVPRE
jgi:hypothetical protein